MYFTWFENIGFTQLRIDLPELWLRIQQNFNMSKCLAVKESKADAYKNISALFWSFMPKGIQNKSSGDSVKHFWEPLTFITPKETE